MPKHIPVPKARVTLTFVARKVAIKHHLDHWYVRVQQRSDIGDTWVTFAKCISPEQALRVAESIHQYDTYGQQQSHHQHGSIQP
jgi:hypothetical protein